MIVFVVTRSENSSRDMPIFLRLRRYELWEAENFRLYFMVLCINNVWCLHFLTTSVSDAVTAEEEEEDEEEGKDVVQPITSPSPSVCLSIIQHNHSKNHVFYRNIHMCVYILKIMYFISIYVCVYILKIMYFISIYVCVYIRNHIFYIHICVCTIYTPQL